MQINFTAFQKSEYFYKRLKGESRYAGFIFSGLIYEHDNVLRLSLTPLHLQGEMNLSSTCNASPQFVILILIVKKKCCRSGGPGSIWTGNVEILVYDTLRVSPLAST